jgi:glycosyltransferase involved in cell wall biosynthesis
MIANPKVSVIIPVYNRERFIAQALDSVLAQTYGNFEIVIVNDGSTDGSEDKIQPYWRYGNVKYHYQQNCGVSAARNAAIRMSSGELIAFLDSDDLWLPDKLAKQVEFMSDHPDVSLVHSNRGYVDINGKRKEVSIPQTSGSCCFKELFLRNGIMSSTVVVTRRCLDVTGLFNCDLPGCEDYELWLRIARQSTIGYVKDVLALYRFHDSNMSRDKEMMARRELETIESIVNMFPEVCQILGMRQVKNRKAGLHANLGGWYMWNAHDFSAARRHFYKAIQLRPFQASSYWLFLWCRLTPSQRKLFDWYSYRLKELIFSKAQAPSADSKM